MIALMSAIILSIILLDRQFVFSGRLSVIQAMCSSLEMRVMTCWPDINWSPDSAGSA